MQRVLGIDIGISSIGYALIKKDDENFIGNILASGVRSFTQAENPKTGESLATPRRESRLTRRRLRRRALRLKTIKNLLVRAGFANEEGLEAIYKNTKNQIDVWELRKHALERSLNPEEFLRILIHIAKRRGFKSVRKSEEESTNGEMLKSIQQTCKQLEDGGYKTAGEMFATIYADGEAKRNKRDTYKNSIPRNLLLEEVKIIFEIQREFNNPFAKEELEEKYIEKAFYQKPFQSVEKMVGNCTFEPQEKRAPKKAYTSEIFTATTKLINTVLIDTTTKEQPRFLSPQEMNSIIEEAHSKTKLTYKQVKSQLNLDENIIFKGLNYSSKDKKPEESAFIELKGYHEIKKSIENNINKECWQSIKYDKNILNQIAIAITFEKSDEGIQDRLRENTISEDIIQAVKNLSMDKVMHLSILAKSIIQ